MLLLPGTSAFGVDVMDYTNVGLTSMVVLHGLSLQEGRPYHVTVRGKNKLMQNNKNNMAEPENIPIKVLLSNVSQCSIGRYCYL